jgi:flagellar basal-body rod protein FlgG
MGRPHGTPLTVGMICAATLVGHWGLARHYQQPGEGLISGSAGFVPILHTLAPDDDGPLVAIDPPPLDETKAPSPNELPTNSRISLLTTATYESEADGPADALHPLPTDEGPAPLQEPPRPLTRRQLEDQAAVREVIDHEMPDSSAEERDIWFEELKSLPAEAVRDLLKVRKQLRVLSPDHHLAGPGPLPPSESLLHGRSVAADAVAQTRGGRLGDWSAARSALEEAICWSTHNLVNAATPGYKRWRVILGDAYEAGWEAGAPCGAGCRIASLSLDLTQGEIVETGRDLDLAIDGPGFFVVRDEAASRRYYTRYGALKLTADRRLALSLDDGEYLLDPPLTIPAAASDISISADGVVRATLPDGNEPRELGQIKLAACPGQLTAHGNGLLGCRGREEVVIGVPGLGVLRQRSLEQSNVDMEREQGERELWQSILEALPTSSIPRTARQGGRAPR